MTNIILIETSTALCSVALAQDGAITSYRESSAPKAHASLTAVFVQEVLQEQGLSLSDCDAVCVSMGPGSYTGLRVGVSTAKGLCFGSGKPLLAVGTLDTLVAQAVSSGQTADDNCQVMTPKFIIPMIDARRMDVYSAIFAASDIPSPSADITGPSTVITSPSADITGPSTVIPSEVEGSPSYTQITETAPAIIDSESFAEYLEQGPCLFIGDGAGKCADVIRHPNAYFCQCHPKASAMLRPAMTALDNGNFQDVAYFEPFYLKEFVATVSKKKLF